MRDCRQLLCTFSSISDLKSDVNDIQLLYKIHNKIFVFSNLIKPKELFITYNINHDNTSENFSKFKNTISIHRKKQTNTLYSLNALNTLIKEENGELDKNFIIDWNLYKNSLIISGDISVRIISLKIFDIIS
jgi:hypothetical protein